MADQKPKPMPPLKASKHGKYPPAVKQKVVDLYCMGETHSAISDKMSIPAATIRKWTEGVRAAQDEEVTGFHVDGYDPTQPRLTSTDAKARTLAKQIAESIQPNSVKRALTGQAITPQEESEIALKQVLAEKLATAMLGGDIPKIKSMRDFTTAYETLKDLLDIKNKPAPAPELPDATPKESETISPKLLDTPPE